MISNYFNSITRNKQQTIDPSSNLQSQTGFFDNFYACNTHLEISNINEMNIAFINNIINDSTGMDL